MKNFQVFDGNQKPYFIMERNISQSNRPRNDRDDETSGQEHVK